MDVRRLADAKPSSSKECANEDDFRKRFLCAQEGNVFRRHGKLIKRRGPRIVEIFQGWDRRRTRFSSREEGTRVFPRYSHHDVLNFPLVQRSRCHFYSCNQAILLLLHAYICRLLLDCVAIFPTRNRVTYTPTLFILNQSFSLSRWEKD